MNEYLSMQINGEVNIFTDGSCNSVKRSSRIGWSFVVEYDENIVHTQHGHLKIGRKKKKLGILYAEATAILNALEYVIAKEFKSAVIFSDSLYNIHAIYRPYVDWKNPVITSFVNRAMILLKQAAEKHIDINILFCKSHNQLEGNELADELAKCGRKKIKSYHAKIHKYIDKTDSIA